MALSGFARDAFSRLCRACARSLPLSASRPRRNSSSNDWAASAPAKTHSRNAKVRVMQPHCRALYFAKNRSGPRGNLWVRSGCRTRHPRRGWRGSVSMVLEPHPNSELDMPLRPRLGTGDGAESRVLHVVVRSAELRRVEQIRGLGAEFGPEPLGNWEVLENREIQGLSGRTGVGLQAQVAFGQVRGRRQGADRCDGAGVKPFAGRAAAGGSRIGVLAGNQIRETTGPYAHATVGAQGERVPGGQRENAVDLPVTDYGIDRLAETAPQLLAASERDVVHEVANQVVANVPRRGGIREVVVRIVLVAEAIGATERGAGVGQGVPVGVCGHEHQAGGQALL